LFKTAAPTEKLIWDIESGSPSAKRRRQISGVFLFMTIRGKILLRLFKLIHEKKRVQSLPMSVAIDAPATPMSRENIKIGSKARLRAFPMIRLYIGIKASPWLL
jgi:hypothetical protein